MWYLAFRFGRLDSKKLGEASERRVPEWPLTFSAACMSTLMERRFMHAERYPATSVERGVAK
jgi:hypothetical protein